MVRLKETKKTYQYELKITEGIFSVTYSVVIFKNEGLAELTSMTEVNDLVFTGYCRILRTKPGSTKYFDEWRN